MTHRHQGLQGSRFSSFEKELQDQRGTPRPSIYRWDFPQPSSDFGVPPWLCFHPPCRFAESNGFPDAMKLSRETQHFDLILGQSVLLSFLRQRCTNELQAVCRKLPEESCPPDFKLSEGVSFGGMGLVNCPKLGTPSQVYPILHLWDGQLNSIWMFNP